jgi:predicted nucleic acid-binding protein
VIVVDTNLLVAAVFDREGNVADVIRRDSVWVAPLLWRSEFRSALAGLIRTQAMPLEHALGGFAQAEELLSDALMPSTERVLALVQSSKCSAYDLEFVALAEELGISLVTNDREVLAAFPGRAVSPAAFVA